MPIVIQDQEVVRLTDSSCNFEVGSFESKIPTIQVANKFNSKNSNDVIGFNN